MLGFPRLVAALSAVVFALAACGGGGSSSGLTPAAAAKGQSGSAALSIFVPSAAASTSSRRRYQLPSSTQSVVIVVASATGTALSSAGHPDHCQCQRDGVGMFERERRVQLYHRRDRPLWRVALRYRRLYRAECDGECDRLGRDRGDNWRDW